MWEQKRRGKYLSPSYMKLGTSMSTRASSTSNPVWHRCTGHRREAAAPPPFPSIKTDTALFQAEDMLQHYIFSSQYQPIPFLYWYLGNRHAAWLTIGHRAPQISVGSSWWGKIVELVFKILTWCTIFMKERRINIEYVISAFQVNISDTNTGLKSGISADTTIKNR